MRHALLLLPLSVLALTGCVGTGAPASQPMRVAGSGVYMTSEQSGRFMMLPGDRVAVAQTGYLSTTVTTEPDGVRPGGL